VGIRFSRKKERNKFARLECLVSDRTTTKRSNGLVWAYLVFEYSKIRTPDNFQGIWQTTLHDATRDRFQDVPQSCSEHEQIPFFLGRGKISQKTLKIRQVAHKLGWQQFRTVSWILGCSQPCVVKWLSWVFAKKSLVVSAPVNPKGEALLFEWWPLKYLTRLQML